MKLVLERRIAPGGHPVLRWILDNIFIRTDPVGNIKPDKKRSTEKIDGVVVPIMAPDRAIRCSSTASTSVCGEHGLLVLVNRKIRATSGTLPSQKTSDYFLLRP